MHNSRYAFKVQYTSCSGKRKPYVHQSSQFLIGCCSNKHANKTKLAHTVAMHVALCNADIIIYTDNCYGFQCKI